MNAPSKKKTASKRQSQRVNLLSLESAQTLGSAVQLKEKIAKSLSVRAALTIDAGAAGAFDLGSLQVLIAAQRAAEEGGQRLSILAPRGSAMMKLAHSAGFFSSAGTPLVPEAARWVDAAEATT